LAETYPHVVADALQSEYLDCSLIIESTSLIFRIKDFLAPSLENFYLERIIPRLISQSENIFHSFDRSKYPIRVPYSPGRSWNPEKSVMKFLLSGDSYFSYSHVVCEERKEKQTSVILLIDKSHSVIQYLQLIIISSIMFSLALQNKNIGIISFDRQPVFIKKMKNNHTLMAKIVEKLVNIRSGGKTDIYTALKEVHKEFSKEISQKKILVMISDLLATSGYDFLPLLRQFEDVRIIVTPRKQTLQLTKPLLGHLRRMKNVNLFFMPQNERLIHHMLERVLYP
ncbi:MAG: VWA domain-containing protein, partial [Candidatus Heimdallarchaeota archaeon]|nr:VWA domain-containing protein [Candidatus Heimdallarchaeota archaeon]